MTSLGFIKGQRHVLNPSKQLLRLVLPGIFHISPICHCMGVLDLRNPMGGKESTFACAKCAIWTPYRQTQNRYTYKLNVCSYT
jgi:hypothetical protein